ncbi:MAG: hypothetical protein U0905_03090 [Pirellulales bacterium]
MERIDRRHFRLGDFLSILAWMVGLWACTLTTAVRGDEITQAGTNRVSKAQLRQWIEDLQGTTYQKRQHAFLGLWQAGTEADEFLQELSQSQDSSGKVIVDWLVLLRKLGAKPADASESLTNLTLLRTGDFHTLVRLGKSQQWGQAIVLLQLLNEDQLERLLEDVSNRELLLAMALEQKHDDVFVPLLDQLYSPQEALAARRLWRRFGYEFPESRSLRMDSLSEILEQEWQGNIGKAIQLANDQGNTPLVQHLRAKHFRWSELLPRDPRLPKPSQMRHGDQLLDAVQQTLLAKWSGDETRSNQWKELIRSIPPKTFDPLEMAAAHVATGDWERGVQILETAEPIQAFQCYRFRGDWKNELRVAGIDDLDQWDIDAWLEAKMTAVKTGLVERRRDFLMCASIASFLHRVGRNEQCEKIEKVLIEIAEADASSNLLELIGTWSDTSRRDRAREYIAQYISRNRKKNGWDREQSAMVENLMEVLYPELTGATLPLLTELKGFKRDRTWRESLDELELLYNGVIPADWSQPSDVEAVLFRVLDAIIADESRQSMSVLALATLAKDLGYYQLSEQLLYRVPSNSMIASMRLDAMAQRGAIDDAIVRSEELQKRRPGDLKLQFLRTQWLEQVGRFDQADAVRKRTLCIPLEIESYVTKHRELKEIGFEKEARELLQHCWETLPTENESADILADEMLRSIEDEKPAQAAELARFWQRANLQANGLISLFPIRQAMMQAKEYENIALNAIRRNDFDVADQAYRTVYSIRPDDINVAIRLVPEAEKFLGSDVAQQWFELYASFQRQHLATFPEDSMFLNNLAWVSAKCNRNLDEAQIAAQKACDLRPNDSTYMDTYAEVKFARGNIAEAISLQEACRKLNAKDPHHKEQLRRYHEALKKEASPQ